MLRVAPATLASALDDLARQTGISVGYAGALPDMRTPRVEGRMTAEAALARLLRGSGLRAVRADASTFRLERVPSRPPVAAGARSAEASDGAAPAEIVVTATKRDEALLGLPLSASVALPDQLLPAGRDTGGVLASADGAFATNLGPGRDRLFLRGVADSPFNGPTQAIVGLYLDDARISYATPDPDLKLVDIDRVEILRGPQGTLYGSGSLGGVVRIVTRAADPTAWSGEAGADVSTVAHGGIGGATEAVLNAPLITDRLALRGSGYAERIGGWIDDPGRSARDVNRVDRSGGRLDLRWTPDGTWSVAAGVTGQWIDAADAQYADGPRALTKATAIAEPHDNDFLAGRLLVHGQLGGAALSLTTAYVAHEVDTTFDASSQVGGPVPTAYDEDRSLRLFSQEARLSGGEGVRTWVLGASYINAVDRLTGTFRGTDVDIARDQHDANSEASLFGEGSRPLTGRLDLRLGIRLFLSREDNERRADTAERSRAHFGATPSATLAWSPRDGARLWLRYASAIRPGGLASERGGATFRADHLQSVEAGWRAALDDGEVLLSGAAYALRWDHIQSDVLGSDGLVSTINAGLAHNVGAEGSVRLGRGPLKVEAGATVQRARLEGSGLPDRRLPVVPDLAAHGRVTLALAVAGLSGEAQLGARYLGSTRLSFDPGLDRRSGGYATFDAGLSLGRGAWRATVALSNLLDSAADTFAFGNPFSVRTTDQRTPIQPRTLSLRLQRAF